MSLQMFLQLILGAVTYSFFHWTFFRYASGVLEKPRLTKLQLAVTYALTYGLFMVVTRLALHLCINWTLIYIMFLIEVGVLYKCNLRTTVLIALDAVTIGLATNIFTRCLTSILLNRPLAHFDNDIAANGTIKIYPVSIAFILAGLVFCFLIYKRNQDQRQLILKDDAGVRFILTLRVIFYLFLLLNLVAYYTEGNSLSMKLWGIKSSVFVLIGTEVARFYVARMSQIRQFQKKIREDRRKLINHQQKNEQMKYLAFTDMLTGCHNRSYIEEIFAEIEETDQDVTLCFLDLDNLKYVNDHFGHLEGDRYLRMAADYMQKELDEDMDYLFRYGGDEFVVLYRSCGKKTAEAHMAALQQKIRRCSYSSEYNYAVSISCGIASRNEAKNLHEVLTLADHRMYEEKKSVKYA